MVNSSSTNAMQHTNRWKQLKRSLLNFNIFGHVISMNNAEEIASERISTRLFFLLLLLGGIILFVYIIVTPDISSETISQPSQTTYEQLSILYPDSLECPCSHTSIASSSFISIAPVSHSVCQSDFVSVEWLEFLSSANQSSYLNFDFRATGSSQFQLLAFLCQLSNASFSLAQATVLDASTLLSLQLLSNGTLQAEATALIDRFRSVSPSSLIRTIDLIRGVTAGNRLVPIIPTLVMYQVFPDFGVLPSPDAIIGNDGFYFSADNSTCSCNQQMTCSSPAGFYPNETLTLNWDLYQLWYKNTAQIPGLLTGCYALESLLQSTLECFFNQTCVDFVQTNVQPLEDVHFRAMKSDSMVLFTPTWTVEQILGQLMIDQWHSSVSYEQYFNQCQPLSCRFLRTQRHSVLYIVTSLIGFIGGLVSVLRLIVPLLVSHGPRCLKCQRTEQSLNVPRVPLMQRISAAICWIKLKICTLNIFANPRIVEDEQSESRGRISTRLYFVLFVVGLFILIFYSLFSIRIQTARVAFPSESQFVRLQSRYSSSVKCPCSTVSIPYRTFLSIDPIYHPVCSSFFISQEWTGSLHGQYSAEYRVLFADTDFRLRASTQMPLIRTFCEMALKTVNDSWHLFEKQEYVSPVSLPRSQFVDEITSKVQQFMLSTVNSFKSSLDLVNMVVQGNQLLIFDSIAMKLVLSSPLDERQVSIELHPWLDSNGTACSCALSSACYSPMSYFYYNISTLPDVPVHIYTFSTFYIGCIPVDSLLQSTLTCFFDEMCLKEIEYNTWQIPWRAPNNSFLTAPTNLSAFNVSSTRFPPSTKLLDIVYQLMVEQWQSSIDFTQYYRTCQPSACTYTYLQRINLLFIVTTVLSFMGGLNTTLRLIVPLVVRSMRRYRINLRIPLGAQVIRVYHRVKDNVGKWNLFPNARTNIDESVDHRQRVNTRFYVCCLICTLVTLTVCRSFDSQLLSESIERPSVKDIEQLKSRYEPVDCPCTNVSISFSSFVSIQFRRHSVCSSDFISDRWQENLYQNGRSNSYDVHDFRKSAFAQFQLLSLLCQLTNSTLSDSLAMFQSNSLTTIKALSVESFNLTVNGLVEQFRSTTSRQFSLILEFTRYLMYGNGIHSALQTSWKYVVFNVSLFPPLYSNPISYNENCTCALSLLCSQRAGIFANTTNTSDYFLIPGMRVGCYPLEALLQSTLQCFYQQTCVDFITKSINASDQVNFTALVDIDDNTTNSTIDMLVAHLFLLDWQTSSDYDVYFSSCAVLTCSYSYTQRLALLYVFTTLLGLYGGTVVIFRAIVPFGVQIMFQCRHYLAYRQRVEPITMNM